MSMGIGIWFVLVCRLGNTRRADRGDRGDKVTKAFGTPSHLVTPSPCHLVISSTVVQLQATARS